MINMIKKLEEDIKKMEKKQNFLIDTFRMFNFNFEQVGKALIDLNKRIKELEQEPKTHTMKQVMH